MFQLRPVVVANLESAIRALKAEKQAHENPLVYRDEFSPNCIDMIPTYGPFRTAPASLLRQRPHIAPRLMNPRAANRRLRVYQTAIVALEQNMLEYSVIEDDLVRVLGVMLSILQQMEKRELTLEQGALRRQQAMKDLQAYSHLTIPRDPIERALLHEGFQELKGRGKGSSRRSVRSHGRSGTSIRIH